jgi:hypothetical protein
MLNIQKIPRQLGDALEKCGGENVEDSEVNAKIGFSPDIGDPLNLISLLNV